MKTRSLNTLIVILITAAAAACSSIGPAPTPGPPAGDSPAATPAPPTPTAEVSQAQVEAPESTPEDPFAGLNFKNGWARIPFNETVFGGFGADQMNDVVAGGPGVVAGGFSTRNGDMNASIWTSKDGIHWARATGSPDLGGAGGQSINALAAGPDALVAVGIDVTGEDIDAAVWYSLDGEDWSRVPATGSVFGDENQQSMKDVAAIGDGFVAVGTERTPEEIRGAVWVSPNGITWQRIEHSEEVFGGANRYATMEQVFPVGDSLLAAGRVQLPGSEDIDAAIWTSHDDGETWTAVDNSQAALGDPGAPRYQLVFGIARGPAAFYMVGTEQNILGTSAEEYINGIIWRSTDGLNWERIYDHKPDFHQQNMLAIAVGELGFTVVGYDVSGDQTQAAAWLSTDGLNWEQVPHFESVFGGSGVQRMNAIAAAGPGFVAVGSTTENGVQDAAVWIYAPDR